MAPAGQYRRANGLIGTGQGWRLRWSKNFNCDLPAATGAATRCTKRAGLTHSRTPRQGSAFVCRLRSAGAGGIHDAGPQGCCIVVVSSRGIKLRRSGTSTRRPSAGQSGPDSGVR